jgi:hypothetical protein
MFEIPRQKPPWAINVCFKKMKDREVKQVLSQVDTMGVGSHKERVNEGEYGRCILCSCMKIE